MNYKALKEHYEYIKERHNKWMTLRTHSYKLSLGRDRQKEKLDELAKELSSMGKLSVSNVVARITNANQRKINDLKENIIVERNKLDQYNLQIRMTNEEMLSCNLQAGDFSNVKKEYDAMRKNLHKTLMSSDDLYGVQYRLMVEVRDMIKCEVSNLNDAIMMGKRAIILDNQSETEKVAGLGFSGANTNVTTNSVESDRNYTNNVIVTHNEFLECFKSYVSSQRFQVIDSLGNTGQKKAASDGKREISDYYVASFQEHVLDALDSIEFEKPLRRHDVMHIIEKLEVLENDLTSAILGVNDSLEELFLKC